MEILTIEQVAALLNVKESWIYARTGDGALKGSGRGRKRKRGSPSRPQACTAEPLERMPHFKAGRLLRFDRAEVLAWWAKFHRNGAEPSGPQPEGVQKPAENAHVN